MRRRAQQTVLNTPEDWQVYISGLSDEDLQAKARGANSLEFVKQLKSEAMTPDVITDILTRFALELQSRGLLVPERGDGSYLSYAALLRDTTPDEDVEL